MINKIKKIIRKFERIIGFYNYKYINIWISQSIPVLAFHWFLSPEDKNLEKYSKNRWYSNIDIFEKQIKWLSENNYTFLTCDEYLKWKKWKKRLPKKSILLTFDDGEISQLKLAEPILKKYNAHGVCFVVGKFLNNENVVGNHSLGEDAIEHFTLAEINKISNSALEYQSHTFDLHYRINNIAAVNFASEKQIEEDLLKMRKLNLDYFAAPYGAYSNSLKKVIPKMYKLSFSINAPGNLYPTRLSNRNRINRIIIDDSISLESFVSILGDVLNVK